MKRLIRVSTLLAALVLVAYAFIGNYFYKVALFRDTKQGISTYTAELDRNSFDAERLHSLAIDTLAVASPHGYTLSGLFLNNPENPTQKTMIMSHGLTRDKWAMVEIADLYLDRGYHVLMYDHRKHGYSGGEYLTYGLLESEDMDLMVDYVAKRFPTASIGVHGVSYGAATALMHAGMFQEKSRISYYVVDCPYSDLFRLFEHRLKGDFGLPNAGIVQAADVASRLRAGFSIRSVAPIDYMPELKETPILFITAEQDDYVPHQMTLDLVEAKASPKDLVIIPEAAHAQGYATNPKLYVEGIDAFLAKVKPILAIN